MSKDVYAYKQTPKNIHIQNSMIEILRIKAVLTELSISPMVTRSMEKSNNKKRERWDAQFCITWLHGVVNGQVRQWTRWGGGGGDCMGRCVWQSASVDMGWGA